LAVEIKSHAAGVAEKFFSSLLF